MVTAHPGPTAKRKIDGLNRPVGLGKEKFQLFPFFSAHSLVLVKQLPELLVVPSSC